jgi:hypothetical protein
MEVIRVVLLLKVNTKTYILLETLFYDGHEAIPMRTKLDLAILPIGDNFTMDVEDAILLLIFLTAIKYWGIIMTLSVI